MGFRRSTFDVTNTVDVTDPHAVAAAVADIFGRLYPRADAEALWQGARDIATLYRGEHADYLECDTAYHDLQHVLDVTLASARIFDGYERSQAAEKRLGAGLFTFGILMALFHDSGYLRRRGVEDRRHGAEFTLFHVGRSGERLKRYLLERGMPEFAEAGAQLVHFTGYEVPAEQIVAATEELRSVGIMVATADMVAQMADRCYLEKCHDRLYPEFDLGGVARKRDADGNEVVVFASPLDLVMKTPDFYRSAKKRMDETLEGAYRYFEHHFGGENLYISTIERNVEFAEYMLEQGASIDMLQRSPPHTPGSGRASSEPDLQQGIVDERRQGNEDRRKIWLMSYPDFIDRRRSKSDRRSGGP